MHIWCDDNLRNYPNLALGSDAVFVTAPGRTVRQLPPHVQQESGPHAVDQADHFRIVVNFADSAGGVADGIAAKLFGEIARQNVDVDLMYDAKNYTPKVDVIWAAQRAKV